MDTNMNEEKCCGQEPEVTVQAAEDASEQELEFLLDKENRSQARMDICKECPELVSPFKMCRQCNCFMTVKTRIFWAKCPLGKW